MRSTPLHDLGRQLDALNRAQQELAEWQRRDYAREVTANVRSQIASYGFASEQTRQDFEQIVVARFLEGKHSEEQSLGQFVYAEFEARPRFAGSYRGTGVSEATLAGPTSVDTPAVGARSFDVDRITPGMSATEFEAAAREIGRCLKEQTESLRGTERR